MIDAAKSVESEKSPVLSPLAAKEREILHNIDTKKKKKKREK